MNNLFSGTIIHLIENLGGRAPRYPIMGHPIDRDHERTTWSHQRKLVPKTFATYLPS